MNPRASGRWVLALLAAGLYGFLYLPLAVVVVFSFNLAQHGLAWQGWTLDWYRRLLADDLALAAARNTLVLGAASTALATALGTALALGLHRLGPRVRQRAQRLLQVPIFIPDIVMAAAMLLFYALARRWLGLFEPGLGTMILAHVTFQVPFVTLVVGARLAGLDPALEEAARDLGATPGRAFRHVTLPLILPGVLAAAMLALTLSLDDFVVSFFTSGPGTTTLPILIYSSVKRGVTPEINALATVLVLGSLLATLGAVLLRRRGSG
jgi:spermidine/putrescine transport system permease protein